MRITDEDLKKLMSMYRNFARKFFIKDEDIDDVVQSCLEVHCKKDCPTNSSFCYKVLLNQRLIHIKKSSTVKIPPAKKQFLSEDIYSFNDALNILYPMNRASGARHKLLKYYSPELDSYLFFTAEEIYNFRWEHKKRNSSNIRTLVTPSKLHFFLFRGKVYPSAKTAGLAHGLNEKSVILHKEIKRFTLLLNCTDKLLN